MKQGKEKNQTTDDSQHRHSERIVVPNGNRTEAGSIERVRTACVGLTERERRFIKASNAANNNIIPLIEGLVAAETYIDAILRTIQMR